MNQAKLNTSILKFFSYNPTAGQSELISRMCSYLSKIESNSIFIIKGYAGTGKTTVVSAIVKSLKYFDTDFCLLAPTGRAAKVISGYADEKAFTIHKKIYKVSATKDGALHLIIQKNKHKNTVFFVDEASMIPAFASEGDSQLFPKSNLLEDLFNYIFEGNNCKLVFIGDTAQLPPVGMPESYALDEDYLKKNYSVTADSYELTEVVRQTEFSGILENATKIRQKINSGIAELPFFLEKNDVINISGTDLEDALNTAYSASEMYDVAVICKSNKRSNIYNREIRNRILFYNNEIDTGDHLMVVKNNYYWAPLLSEIGFIANGDIIELLKIRKIEDMYGFRFADVTIRMVDYPEEKEFDVKIILSSLDSETPSMTWDDSKKLFAEVMKDYEDIAQKYKRYKKAKENPYLNALQVKFAYAFTCHKTQGGQWKTVFVEQGYLTDEMIDTEYLRWLYTAVTRATDKLYLVNFRDMFFEKP
jgi:exodeoxyribonuclease-5